MTPFPLIRVWRHYRWMGIGAMATPYRCLANTDLRSPLVVYLATPCTLQHLAPCNTLHIATFRTFLVRFANRLHAGTGASRMVQKAIFSIKERRKNGEIWPFSNSRTPYGPSSTPTIRCNSRARVSYTGRCLRKFPYIRFPSTFSSLCNLARMVTMARVQQSWSLFSIRTILLGSRVL